VRATDASGQARGRGDNHCGVDMVLRRARATGRVRDRRIRAAACWGVVAGIR
jgi:hypothetical protein